MYKLAVLSTIILLVGVAQATPIGKCNGVGNCNDIDIDKNQNYNKNTNSSESNSVGVGIGGDSSATGGDAYSKQGQSQSSRNKNVAEGGDSYSGSTSGVSDSGNSASASGASAGIETNDSYSVDASDNSSYSSSYSYQEAAKSAAILYGQVCSDVTNIQGVKFGLASSRQSTFCMRLTVAQGFYAAAAMLGCADAESVGKGAEYVRSPSPSACERDQRQLYARGTDQLVLASELVDARKRGLIRRAWNAVVW